MQYLGAISKATEWFWFVSKAKQLIITVIQVYVRTTNAKEAEVEQFYEDLQDLLELTPKRCPFHHRGLEWKCRESRNSWSNRQIWPWGTKWSWAKVNRVLPRNSMVITNTLFQQHKKRLHMDITRWSTPKSDWLYSLQPKMEKLYTVSKNKTRSWRGSINEFLIAKSDIIWRK